MDGGINKESCEQAYEEYISRYCRTYGIDRETALTHELVKWVGRYYESVKKRQNEACKDTGLEQS